MPKKGIVKCEECDKEFEGIFPDNKEVDRYYVWYPDRKGEIDQETATAIFEHHLDSRDTRSASGGMILGHRRYEVFLGDGNKGEILASAYVITYKELGKER